MNQKHFLLSHSFPKHTEEVPHWAMSDAIMVLGRYTVAKLKKKTLLTNFNHYLHSFVVLFNSTQY